MAKAQNKRMLTVEKEKKQSPVKFRLSIIVVIFLLSVGICFAIYMLDANVNDEEFIKTLYSSNSDDEKTESNNDSSTVAIVNPVPQSAAAKDASYLSECVFTGDTVMEGITSAFNVSEKYIKADISSQDAVTSVSNTGTANVYVMMGSDTLSGTNKAELISSYSFFITSLKSKIPDAKIYIMSIPPVTAAAETESVTNAIIDDYNSALLDTAKSQGVYYVDVNTGLRGVDGKLPANYADTDGKKLNTTAYDVIKNYILSHTA